MDPAPLDQVGLYLELLDGTMARNPAALCGRLSQTHLGGVARRTRET